MAREGRFGAEAFYFALILGMLWARFCLRAGFVSFSNLELFLVSFFKKKNHVFFLSYFCFVVRKN